MAYVAFVGAPNSGKTTLYNRLTKSTHKTVNYPGSTVDYAQGNIHAVHGSNTIIVDTPGTYSLFPKSPDEKVTVDLLFKHLGTPRLIVATVDVHQISRHLLVVEQLIEANFNVVVALTMTDLVDVSKLDIQAISNAFSCPVVPVSGASGEGVDDLVRVLDAQKNLLPSSPQPLESWTNEKQAKHAKRYSLIQDQVYQQAISEEVMHRTRQLDQWILHPIFGLSLFLMIMFGLFSSIFWLAAPFMDWVDGFFGSAAGWVLSVAPDALWADFIANGMIGSMGAVLVFVPQIAILFIGISLLEDSGYLARACSLIDKPLSKLGLNGRSFVPLLSGYACAIPAMMAARSIPSKKEKMLTLFVIPLMSCSARLPVYALLLSFLFWEQAAWKPGLGLACIYLLSIVVGAIAAAIGNRMIQAEQVSFLVHELPYYRRPGLRLVAQNVLSKTWAYIKKAGPIIFFFSILFWLGTTFPNTKAANDVEKLQTSYAAQVGQVIEPVMEPMGGDWRTGTALLAAFTAREVFVSALALVFYIADEEEASLQTSLIQSMQQAKTDDGRPLFTTASVLGLIVFFMIALQCMTTVGVARKEFGNWKWPLIQLGGFTLVAYVLAVAVVQGLRLSGIA